MAQVCACVCLYVYDFLEFPLSKLHKRNMLEKYIAKSVILQNSGAIKNAFENFYSFALDRCFVKLMVKSNQTQKSENAHNIVAKSYFDRIVLMDGKGSWMLFFLCTQTFIESVTRAKSKSHTAKKRIRKLTVMGSHTPSIRHRKQVVSLKHVRTAHTQ